MQICCKVGDRANPTDLTYNKKYRDGQILDQRPDGYYNSYYARRHFCIIDTQHDFWKLRGSSTWDADIQKVYDLKKYLTPAYSDGKYPWELGYQRFDEERGRRRDYFIDFKYLLNQGWITQSCYESIYNFDVEHQPIYLDRDFLNYYFHEEVKDRLVPGIKNMAIQTGTYSIGSGLNYNDVGLFEADIDTSLSGDLTGEHNNEATSISAAIIFDTNTGSNTLTLTAQSGDEHGGKYENARITMGTFDNLQVDETTDGHMDNFVISKLALQLGNNCVGVYFDDGGDDGHLICERMVINGNSATNANGIFTQRAAKNCIHRNNIIYDCSNKPGISMSNNDNDATYETYNNTVIECDIGIYNDHATRSAGILKNNLCYNNSSNDYVDDGGGYDTTAKNVSKDATSPDVAYRSWDPDSPSTPSCFTNYAGDDFTLDETEGTLDDGDDLSAIGSPAQFSDDVAGNDREAGHTPKWFIGASEFLTAVEGRTTKNTRAFPLGERVGMPFIH